ncbi:hypothetical protein ACFE04_010709 [Oxalis oulophora]
MHLPPYLLLLSIILLLIFSTFAATVPEFYAYEQDALLQLKDAMSLSATWHSLWTGPPCSRNQSRWPGITCANSHVVALVLEGIQLTGTLPPAFLQNITFLTKLSFKNNTIDGPLPSLVNLVHMEHVFLSQNRFSGSIPLEYTQLPKLEKLELQHNYLYGNIPPFNQSTLEAFNASYNNLEGSIPQTISLQSFPKTAFDHNLALCGEPLSKSCSDSTPAPASSPTPPLTPTRHNKGLNIWYVAVIAVTIVMLLILVMLLLFFCYCKRGQSEETKMQARIDRKIDDSRSTGDPEKMVELELFDHNISAFDLDDLLRASAQVLGKSNIGTTYKVTLESGCVAVVKRIKTNALTKKDFDLLVQFLGKLKHKNLVKIISFYNSKDEKLIVYEFITKGNLFDLLHGSKGGTRTTLDWVARLSLIKDIAKGLSSLQQSLASHRVPHANLKSSNVLIEIQNENLEAKLTDYGFLPLLPSSCKNLAIGRCPEFCQGKKLTHKADVYCFGIILLEIITGKIPGEMYGQNFEDLGDWVRMVVNNDWSTDILDVEIVSAKEGHDEMLKLTEIALECTDVAPEKRPKMNEVLKRIQEIELNI